MLHLSLPEVLALFWFSAGLCRLRAPFGLAVQASDLAATPAIRAGFWLWLWDADRFPSLLSDSSWLPRWLNLSSRLLDPTWCECAFDLRP
eukprot:4498476-Amphidinium_carterae.1